MSVVYAFVALHGKVASVSDSRSVTVLDWAVGHIGITTQVACAPLYERDRPTTMHIKFHTNGDFYHHARNVRTLVQ